LHAKFFVLFAAALVISSCACEEEQVTPPSSPSEPVGGAGAIAGPGRPGAAEGSEFSIIHVVDGVGATPLPSDLVTVHYEGRLADGSVFDSSIARGRPAAFPLDAAILCWTRAVSEMKAGGRATLVCPPELAYGAAGLPGIVPPNATLTFQIELLSIGTQPSAAAGERR
jgi:FKBP-type peptidyl-prolyl cis-trans isomerase FkpA